MDDDSNFLITTKRILKQDAFQVDSASSVEKAFAKMRKKKVDAVVSDYQMPVKDGLQFLRELRAKGNDIPFILFTGKCKGDVAIEALNLGADYYLNKFGKPETVYRELAQGIRQTVKTKRLELALRKSEEKYKLIFELSPDGIGTLNTKGIITSVNPAFYKQTGFTESEIIGKHLTKLGTLKTKDIFKYVKFAASILRGKKPSNQEFDYVTKDGTPCKSEGHFALIKEEGKTTGLLAILRDITERKKAEEELLLYSEHLEELVKDRTNKLTEQNIRLKRLDEMKSRFISTATHELRTPLVSIKGYTELIRSGMMGEVPKKIDELFKVVERNADRLSKLTDDLLDQQRLESGRLEISPEPLQLQELIEEVVEEFQPFIKKRNQVLNVQVPTDLSKVMVDRTRVGQVIINLLSNASKFTPSEGNISIKARETGEMVEVQVSDTGMGIAREDIPKLFEPFPDIPKPDFTESSVGLGLSICKGIIDLHGGKFWAKSKGKDKGTIFTFTIPKRRKLNERKTQYA